MQICYVIFVIHWNFLQKICENISAQSIWINKNFIFFPFFVLYMYAQSDQVFKKTEISQILRNVGKSKWKCKYCIKILSIDMWLSLFSSNVSPTFNFQGFRFIWRVCSSVTVMWQWFLFGCEIKDGICLLSFVSVMWGWKIIIGSRACRQRNKISMHAFTSIASKAKSKTICFFQ